MPSFNRTFILQEIDTFVKWKFKFMKPAPRLSFMSCSLRPYRPEKSGNRSRIEEKRLGVIVPERRRGVVPEGGSVA